jgi:hypothetical protein
MHKPPSAWSIISIDNACWAMITSAPMVLLIALLIKLTGTMPGRRGGPDIPVDPEVASMVLAGAVALVLLLARIVALRVRRIQGLFERGHEVEASVAKVTYVRGGMKLVLEFELHGTPYEVRCSFVRWPRTPAFSEGTRTPVLVDPENPKRAIPLALYGDPRAAQRGRA